MAAPKYADGTYHITCICKNVCPMIMKDSLGSFKCLKCGREEINLRSGEIVSERGRIEDTEEIK